MKKDIVEAAATGDRLETLIALRGLLAERLQKTKSDRDVASLSRRLMQVIAEIESLEKERGQNENQVDKMRRKLRLASQVS